MPLQLYAAEITREKIFQRLRQELPYAIAVEPESWEEFDNGEVKISQVVYVRKEGQKKIILGKGGGQIKEIGEKARKELTQLFERPVHLFLHVKIKENWVERPTMYTTDVG